MSRSYDYYSLPELKEREKILIRELSIIREIIQERESKNDVEGPGWKTGEKSSHSIYFFNQRNIQEENNEVERVKSSESIRKNKLLIQSIQDKMTNVLNEPFTIEKKKVKKILPFITKNNKNQTNNDEIDEESTNI